MGMNQNYRKAGRERYFTTFAVAAVPAALAIGLAHYQLCLLPPPSYNLRHIVQPIRHPYENRARGNSSIGVELESPSSKTQVKREVPPQTSDNEWNKLVARGWKLLRAAKEDSTGATAFLGFQSQSPYTEYTQLKRYGWKSADGTYMLETVPGCRGWFDISMPMRSTVRELGLSTASRRERNGVWSGGNVHMTWQHEEPYTVDGKRFQPTNAFHTVIYNNMEGVIYALGVYGPRFKGEQQSPPVFDAPALGDKLSDVLFLEWQHQADLQKTDIKNLRYYFQLPVKNTPSQAAMARALNGRPVSKWPGVTLSMDSEEGKALLGTANGNGLGWFLINHKAQLGLKTVESVTVFEWDGKEGVAQDPSMMFKVKDV